MGKFEHKANSGSIFKNDYKTAEKHPDYKGQVNVNGTLYDIALWVKEGANGKFFSVSLSEPYVRPDEVDAVVAEAQTKAQPTDDDMEIPF